jgi:pSer/pThr/pTyr-binding forkhead associated (FHA) protein
MFGQGGPERHTIVKPRGPEISSVAWLYCQKGLRKGQLYQFRKQRNEFGRAPDCDVMVEDEYSSAHHGAVLLEEGVWKIYDFASTNGTILNGKRLGVDSPNPSELNDRDVVTIADPELVFKKG